MQDIFTKTDLSHYMDNNMDLSAFPSGHIRRSDGWRKKVVTRYNNLDTNDPAIVSYSPYGSGVKCAHGETEQLA
jgi:hypothetical protein